MYDTLYIHMVQFNAIGDWSSLATIIGVMFSIALSVFALYKNSKKENNDTYARQDIVNKDFELINARLDDHIEKNEMQFEHFKDLLEEVKSTIENVDRKTDVLIKRK